MQAPSGKTLDEGIALSSWNPVDDTGRGTATRHAARGEKQTNHLKRISSRGKQQAKSWAKRAAWQLCVIRMGNCCGLATRPLRCESIKPVFYNWRAKDVTKPRS